MVAFPGKLASYIGLLFFVSTVYQAIGYKINGGDCGKPEMSPTARIVGGKNVVRETQPWVVNLQVYFVEDKKKSAAHPCGGTLITRRFVLTAARCVLRALDKGKGSLASIVEVYHNETERRKGGFRRARDIIIHPGFDPLTRKHNIALLRLFKPVPKSKHSRPICLMDKTEVLMRKNATALGWGWITESLALRYATVKIVPFTTCQKKLEIIKKRKVLDNRTMICTSGVKKGPCRGDGGGPVTIKREGNRIYQVGVISFPRSCDASRDIPSAHVRVDYYYAWIKNVVEYFHKWHVMSHVSARDGGFF
ncbi:venom peptide isomerase heavy chain-like isoform X2 [Dermacentor variabilis]|uniref:venom peptide isomerase heavy chain-like isoform X2 n=1 Tax=Dermacentor variabilis TaxID=34621 RepID=UPI003F5BB526